MNLRQRTIVVIAMALLTLYGCRFELAPALIGQLHREASGRSRLAEALTEYHDTWPCSRNKKQNIRLSS